MTAFATPRPNTSTTPQEILLEVSNVLNSTSTSALKPTELVTLVAKLNTPEVHQVLRDQVLEYFRSFSYRAITSQGEGGTRYAEPLRFIPDPESISAVLEKVTEAATQHEIGAVVLRNVLLRPEVLAKLVSVYEHGSMLGAQTPIEKEAAVRRVLLQQVTEDATLRFVRAAFPQPLEKGGESIDVYQLLSKEPEAYTRAALAHRWACKLARLDPFDTEAQLKLKNGENSISAEILAVLGLGAVVRPLGLPIANLRKAPIFCNREINIGESLFFQPLQDKRTLELSQFLFDAFERGIRNVEIACDLLPFDPTKRLPGEFSREECSRLRCIAKTLNQSLTVHSPIVGPIHAKTKFTSILEDAADNVQLMKNTIDLAEQLGAKTVVVHISDRLSPEAIEKYAEIARHAAGKLAADGTPMRVAFENYMSKGRPDGSRPFPTMLEHFEAFSEIVFSAARATVRDQGNPTQTLAHIAVLLDSAHFNLVTNFEEDPLKAIMDLRTIAPKLGQRLIEDPEVGPALVRSGFNKEAFAFNIVAQLHLNQNIGPIGFTVPGSDYNADLHNPVESIGSIDNGAFVALVYDAGFAPDSKDGGLVILAEQKTPLSPGGLQSLYASAQEAPAAPMNMDRVEHFIAVGTAALGHLNLSDSDVYQMNSAILYDQNRQIHPHYSWLAGRFGTARLIEHLKRRACHYLLCAPVDTKWAQRVAEMPFSDVAVTSHAAGDILIQKGVTYAEAKATNSNKFFLVVSGTAVVKTEKDDFILKPGTPFGEAMFLSGTPRNSNVCAGPEGVRVVEISEPDFWSMYKLIAPFQERLDQHFRKRQQQG